MAIKAHYDQEVVRVVDLAVARSQVRDVVFTDCLILGPAVLMLMGEVTLVECQFDAPGPDSIYYIIPPDTPMIGVVGMANCEFLRCRFQEIGFAGPAEGKEAFVRGTSGAPPWAPEEEGQQA